MNRAFEEWWKEMKPAECDEVKPYFEECWQRATERAAKIVIETPICAPITLAAKIREQLHD